MRPPGFIPPIDIADVHLDDGAFAQAQRIEDRYGVVAEGRWVDHDAGGVSRLVQPADHLVLGIGLVTDQFQSQPPGSGAAQSFHVGQRVVAVEVRLTLSEQIQIRPVQQINA